MKLKSLRDLYVHELKDIYSAEKQIIAALPKMTKATQHEELVAAFEEHLEQTQVHLQRVEKILKELGETTKGDKCKGMEGLLEEASKMLEEDTTPDVLDAALIGAAQKVEHYEIASYGTVRTYAEVLGEDEAAELLQMTLDEEVETDEKLTELAESSINAEAEDEDDDDEK